jgi:lipoprotein signal peptidase
MRDIEQADSMTLLVYLVLFVSVITADQLSKQWAIRALPAIRPGQSDSGSGWTRAPSRPLEELGGVGATVAWLIAGAGGAALCLAIPGGAYAALGGVAAWAAAASNLGEWLLRGNVVDWLPLWPRSLTNLADAALILGAAQLPIWVVLA